MAVLMNTLLFLVGLVLLVWGSDIFIRAAASIAKRLGISGFVIGLTLVAIATSIPELASSIVSALKGETGIVLGNILGSNIANIGLIVGISALIAGVNARKRIIDRDGYILVFVSALFFVFAFNGVLSLIESIFLLLLYISYVAFIFQTKPRQKEKYRFGQFLKYFLEFKYITTMRSRLFTEKKKTKKLTVREKKVRELIRAAIIKDLFVLSISMVAVIFGANYVVNGAIYFSEMFNISNTIIGATLIAVGTSLPELAVSVTAIRKGYGNIAFGNIVGSNISNLLLVMGISGLITPIAIDRMSLVFTIPYMFAISVAFIIFARSDLKIKEWEGTTLLILYSLFLIFLVS